MKMFWCRLVFKEMILVQDKICEKNKKKCWKLFVANCFRGNDFALMKNFRLNYFDENF